MSSGLFPGMPQIASSLAKQHFFQTRLKLHPPRLSVTLLPSFPVILLKYYIYPYILLSTFSNFTSSSSTSNLQPARWGITIHRRITMPTLREHLNVHERRQPILIANQMFELPTQPLSIVLEIANVYAMSHMEQDDDNTDREIIENESEYPSESKVSSDTEEDTLDTLQNVLHLDQAHRDKRIHSTRIPLPKIRSRGDTGITHTSLPHLWHPARAIAPPFLKRQKWTIDILRQSDVVPTQALPLPKTGRFQNVPH